MSDEQVTEVRTALAHIVDASSALTRDQAMIAATALRAGWLRDEERAVLRDLSSAFDRLSAAGVAEVAS